MKDWIKVEDELPSNNENVLIACKVMNPFCKERQLLRYVTTGYHYEGKWTAEGDVSSRAQITHWMPYPDLPKE